jgi:hypothetical protein
LYFWKAALEHWRASPATVVLQRGYGLNAGLALLDVDLCTEEQVFDAQDVMLMKLADAVDNTRHDYSDQY